MTAINPASLEAGSVGQTITISGTGFTATTQVQIDGTVLSTTYVSSTTLKATLPDAVLASGRIASVTLSDGSSMTPSAFQWNVTSPTPAITAVNPSVVAPGGSAVITVTGSGFEANSVVLWNGSARATKFVSPISLEVTLTAQDVQSFGAGQITVMNPGPSGSTTGGSPVVVAQPLVLTSVTPSTLLVGAGAQSISVTGAGFDGTAVVLLNGSPLTTTVVSATSLQAIVPASATASTGTAKLLVQSAGASSGPLSLAINNPQPTIASLSPASASAGDGPLTLTITGTGFVSGTTLSVNGVTRQTNYVSGSNVSTTLSTADLAVVGTLAINVINAAPGGGNSASVAFQVQTSGSPAISSFTPTSVASETATLLHVLGSGFVSSSVVQWNGSPLPTQYVSGSELSASLAASATGPVGAATLTVSNPATGIQSAASSVPVVNPVPGVVAVSPSAIFADAKSTTLQVQGSGFQSSSTVIWNGSALPSTYVNGTQLNVVVPQTTVASATSATLIVTTPAPGGGSSAVLNVPVYPAKPVITDVQQFLQGSSTCQAIALDVITNNPNIYDMVVLLNGKRISYPTPQYGSGVLVTLPTNLGAVANPQITIASAAHPDDTSDSVSLDPISAFCVTPSAVLSYPGTTMALDISETVLGTAPVPTVTGLTLPSGFNATTAAPYAVPSRVLVNSATTVAAGSYSLGFQVSTGATAKTVSVPVTMSTTPPSLFFTSGQNTNFSVTTGGSVSLTLSTTSNSVGSPQADFLVTPSIAGLPPGVSATFTPTKFLSGSSLQVTLNADTSAPLQQNVPVTISGTIDGTNTNATTSLQLSVTKGPGTIPNNRMSLTALGATPVSLAYDRVHHLVFASNPVWNRIDVLSSDTRAVVRSIPLASPVQIDLSQDNNTLWIGTQSQQVFAMSTSSFAVISYTLPKIAFYSNTAAQSWVDRELLVLSNGDLLLDVSDVPLSPTTKIFSWTPGSGTLSPVNGSLSYGLLRSGDGTKVFSIPEYVQIPSGGCLLSVLQAGAGTTTNYPINGTDGGTSHCGTLQAINGDGSLLITTTFNNSTRGFQWVSGMGRSLPSAPLVLQSGYLSTPEMVNFNPRQFAFSDDGQTLYQTGTLPQAGSLVATYSVATRSLVGLAPAITSPTPPGTSGYGGPTILAVATPDGILIGTQNFGVAFEDSTYFQNYGSSTNPLGAGSLNFFNPLFGPLSGGTTFSSFAAVNLLPDVWFGDVRGMASLPVRAPSTLSITSPAGAAPGPVDLKAIFPNGTASYAAQAFSYGPYPQHMVYSGSAPQGGASAVVTGFGLPADSSTGSITVGGSAATITSTVGQYPPFTGESVPSTYLNFTMPAGRPGFAICR